LRALEHAIALARDAAGRDGIISKADQQRLLSRLDAEGRGAAHFAAGNLLRLATHRDAGGPGARLTVRDLEATGAYVADRLLARVDRGGDGYSADEIARMSATARGLVDLGRLLEVEARSGRTGHIVPELAIAHTAKLAVDASGPDGVLGGDERAKLLASLRDQGRGAEAGALENLFRHIDTNRPRLPGKVTAGDLRTAMANVRSQLSRLDLNRNGYSREELAPASPLVKSLFEVGRLIDAGAVALAGPRNFVPRDPPTPGPLEGRVTDVVNRLPPTPAAAAEAGARALRDLLAAGRTPGLAGFAASGVRVESDATGPFVALDGPLPEDGAFAALRDLARAGGPLESTRAIFRAGGDDLGGVAGLKAAGTPDRATRETMVARLKAEMARLGGFFATGAEVQAAIRGLGVEDLRLETNGSSPVGVGNDEVQLSLRWGLSDHGFFATWSRTTNAIVRVESFN
jgi:hypothetical protein